MVMKITRLLLELQALVPCSFVLRSTGGLAARADCPVALTLHVWRAMRIEESTLRFR